MSVSTLRRAAFFDVDGTLTRTTTMFDLVHFDAAERGQPADAVQFLHGLRRMQLEDGVPRATANRHYFAWWQGRSPDALRGLIARWLAARPASYFHAAVLAKLHMHRVRGDAIVLVSGSVPALLVALADELGADHVLATNMLVDCGVFTGAIDGPMIEDRKTDAVHKLAADCGLDLAGSSAYGDHTSDVPFLELTGDPVICSTPGTAEWKVAENRGWDRVLLDG
ncbi:HAD family hydrolase [Curtobacterium sp. MCBA15_013]|uniref:HAD family hydrolase n=1 Tax=Curtobacterium sp. MCBA15_013 TaxID=1898739 RepID=UPI0008DE14F4|nr:HAD-IB family hydrolase [Curtobacterium sp. MCBA15_013]OII18423.1 hypothetical protein BIV01_02440 [Curtobacterium sp. MCBA15_013]